MLKNIKYSSDLLIKVARTINDKKDYRLTILDADIFDQISNLISECECGR